MSHLQVPGLQVPGQESAPAGKPRQRIFSVYWPTNSSTDIQSAADEKVTDIHSFFEPLINILRRSGLLNTHENEESSSCCETSSHGILYSLKVIYLALVWIWTVGMSVNIFYRAITSSEQHSTDGHHPNMIIQLLEESPYSFITIRSALLLTIFVANSPQLLDAVHKCAALRMRMTLVGANVSLEKIRNRPQWFIWSTIVMILLWEIHEWSVWFFSSELGPNIKLDLTPFPATILQWQYAICWSVFTTIPFIFAQLSLCFPVLFAYVLRKFCRFINKELLKLTKLAKLEDDGADEVVHNQISQRLTILRSTHFDVSNTLRQVDDAVATLLLIQFISDVIVLFGFLGLLVNTKHSDPPVSTVEWTFYIVSSLLWFFFFLFNYSFPMIYMAEEAERTHQIVHQLTFSSPSIFKERFDDIRVFLNEVRENTLAFTGGHFYYITRHYIVTCVALIASYLTVLSEILDRYYSTEHIKHTMGDIVRMLENSTSPSLSHTAHH